MPQAYHTAGSPASEPRVTVVAVRELIQAERL
nr:MAG TPA: hypothetical protein [Caudoviricetes sp.]